MCIKKNLKKIKVQDGDSLGISLGPIHRVRFKVTLDQISDQWVLGKIIRDCLVLHYGLIFTISMVDSIHVWVRQWVQMVLS